MEQVTEVTIIKMEVTDEYSFVESEPMENFYFVKTEPITSFPAITLEKLAKESEKSHESMKLLPPLQITEFADYLNSMAEPVYEFFTFSNCKNILKALIIFVVNTPVAVSKNLFMENQKTDDSASDVASMIQHRNWCFVLGHLWRLHVLEQEMKNEKVHCVADVLPIAELMGYIVTNFHRSPNEYISAIFGFWIAKIYMVSNSGIKLDDFPTPLKEAYLKFVSWKGESFHYRLPSLPLTDHFLTKFGVTSQRFPFALVEDIKVLNTENLKVEQPEFTASIPICDSPAEMQPSTTYHCYSPRRLRSATKALDDIMKTRHQEPESSTTAENKKRAQKRKRR